MAADLETVCNNLVEIYHCLVPLQTVPDLHVAVGLLENSVQAELVQLRADVLRLDGTLQKMMQVQLACTMKQLAGVDGDLGWLDCMAAAQMVLDGPDEGGA